MTTKPTMADVIAAHQMKRGVRDMRIHCTCGWVADIDRGRAGEQLPVHQAAMLAAAGFGDTTAVKAEAWVDAAEVQERVADTLAYYQCRRNNPKADHPRMGYHAFSEDQREFLRSQHTEAAAEITRMIFTSKRDAAEEALREAADDLGGFGYITPPRGHTEVADWLRDRADKIEEQTNE